MCSKAALKSVVDALRNNGGSIETSGATPQADRARDIDWRGESWRVQERRLQGGVAMIHILRNRMMGNFIVLKTYSTVTSPSDSIDRVAYTCSWMLTTLAADSLVGGGALVGRRPAGVR